MWLFNSSIGKKFIMALTGICLVLFVTFHVLMNAVAIFSPTAYNAVCASLGANWYALIASAGLGLLVVIHIIDALVLTIQNRKARGNNRYAVSARPKTVEWSSQNMLVLGIVVLAFLGVHIVQFWARMQAQELLGTTYVANGVPVIPQAGTLFIQLAFQEIWTPIVYIIGFAALWFHLNHGFWSMWQSIGWDNDKWLPRLKCISKWWVSIVIALFTIQAVVFTINARNKVYVEDPALIRQYTEMYLEHYENEYNAIDAELRLLAVKYNAITNNADMTDEQRAAEINTIDAEARKLSAERDSMVDLLNKTYQMDLANKLPQIAEKPVCEAAVCTPAENTPNK